MDSSAVPPLSLMVQRSLPQTPAQVWAAWTTSAGIAGWWGPAGTTVTVADLDVAPGGKFSITSTAPGRSFRATGIYTEVCPERLLGCTWTWETGDNELVDRPTQLRVQLELDHDGGTRIRVEQAGFPDAVSRDRHIEGWQRALEGLAASTPPKQDRPTTGPRQL